MRVESGFAERSHNMQPRARLDNLEDVSALALELHCQCSDLSGPYENASKHLEILHDTLNKVSELWEDESTAHETAALNEVVIECRRVLNAIDLALDQDRQPLAYNSSEVKFTIRIAIISERLLNTYKVALHARESNDYPLIAVHAHCGLRTSCELDGATSTASKLRRSQFTHRSGAATSSISRHLETTCGMEDTRPSPIALDSWKAPFAVADPMSIDIETASRLILTQDTTSPFRNDGPTALGAPIQLPIGAADTGCPCDGNGSSTDLRQASTAASLSCHGMAPPSVKVDSVYDDEEATSRLARDAPRKLPDNTHGILSRPQAHTEMLAPGNGNSSTKVLSRQELRQSTGSKSKYHIVNADPSEYDSETSDNTSECVSESDEHPDDDVPIIPRRNPRRTLSCGSAEPQKRMAQVFTWDSADGDDAENLCSASVQSECQSLGAEAQPIDCKEGVTAGFDNALDLEAAITARIVHCWNVGDLAQAELHLEEFLEHRPESRQLDADRRTRHLMGVIASLKGKQEQALFHFSLVFSKRVLDIAHLEVADCAAAFWMGDIYCLSDRRLEALIAYSIAEQGIVQMKADLAGSTRQQIIGRLQAEQAVCRSGDNKAYFEKQLDEMMQGDGCIGTDSILNRNVMTRDTAHTLLGLIKWPVEGPHNAKTNQSRAIALSNADSKSTTWQEVHGMQLSASALEPSAPWPMPFDPLFAIGNIACGLSLSSRQDLLQLKTIPRRSAALSRSRMNGFTCQNLRWLIVTLRACMDRLELKYTEFANSTGTWFISKYAANDGAIASTRFISISIYRLTIRSGFGVEICPGGIFSSRLTSKVEKKDGDEGSSHGYELKRVKKLIRNYLDAALRRQEAIEDRITVVPVMSINGVASMPRVSSPKLKKRQSSSISSPATSSKSGSLLG